MAQLVPNAEILIVTTPQQAAAEVAERAGTIALQTHQTIVGVIENMSGMPCPHCGEMVDVFGTGGGQTVSEALTKATGARVPVLGSIPIDIRLREGGDDGTPVVLSDPDSPAGVALRGIAGQAEGRRASGASPGCRLGHHAAQQVLNAPPRGPAATVRLRGRSDQARARSDQAPYAVEVRHRGEARARRR